MNPHNASRIKNRESRIENHHSPFTMLLILALLLWLSPPQRAVLQDDPAREFYQQVKQARLSAGLPPLDWSTPLSQAAQRHAADMATNQLIDTTGSDGSTPRQRVREAGYHAWHDGLLVSEVVWVGLGSAEHALNWFRNAPEHWTLFVDSQYREMGVGYAVDAGGVHYYVVNFGARPGVLPIFINDGAETADSPQIAVSLTNEDAEPLGEGNWIGRAIDVRLNNSPDFEGIPWQPWEPLLPWVLPGIEPGDYAVYAEFRDGASRTAISEDTIRLVETDTPLPTSTPPQEEATTPTPLSTASPTPSPEITPVPITVTETLTITPALTPTPPPTEIAVLPEATPQPTWTPLPEPAPVTAPKPVDWTLWAVILLQGLAWLLGLALFLRRR